MIPEFRGRRVDNGEWVYGFYCLTKFPWTLISGSSPERKLAEKCVLVNKNREWFAAIMRAENVDSILNVDPATVGQFTGLQDKNGKETFTGDILDTPVGKATIRFGPYSQPSDIEYHQGFSIDFECEESSAMYRKDIGYWLLKSVVIGNIHERPHLLPTKMDGHQP